MYCSEGSPNRFLFRKFALCVPKKVSSFDPISKRVVYVFSGRFIDDLPESIVINLARWPAFLVEGICASDITRARFVDYLYQVTLRVCLLIRMAICGCLVSILNG